MINMSLSNSNNYELKYRAYIDGNWTKWISQGNDCGSKNTGIIKDIQIKLVYVSHITSVTLNKSSLSLSKGNTETLQATINPSDTTDAKTLTWKSEDENIAKVDGNGNVTGVGTGTTNITVTTSNGKSATCKVTVVRQTPSVNYSTHVQDIGWQGYVKDGSTAGTTGQSKRLEAIRIKLSNNTSYNGTIQYQTHIQDIGWQGWKANGQMAGTSGQSKRLEAIRIKLTGEMAKQYDIYYRVHSQEFGWLGWAKNGESAGTEGYSYRLEAIQIQLVKKGGSAPGSTSNKFHRYNSWVSQLNVAKDTSQLIVVSANGSNYATVSMHTKGSDGYWADNYSVTGRVGKNGIGKTSEGDKKLQRVFIHLDKHLEWLIIRDHLEVI